MNNRFSKIINAEGETQEAQAEIRNRLEAVEIIEKGIKAANSMIRHLRDVIAKEKKMLDQKREHIQSKNSDRWWDMNESGWAKGGVETLGDLLSTILHSLNETKLAEHVQEKIGFTNRVIPISKPVINDRPGEKRENDVIPVEATFDPSGLPYARALGSDWGYGEHNLEINSNLARMLSAYLKDQEIDHVFTGGCTGNAKINFRTEADMLNVYNICNFLLTQ